MRYLGGSRLYPLGATALAILIAGFTQANAACTGAGAPTNTQTRCLTAIPIPGVNIRSFDISWVNPDRGEYYLGDRSSAGIDIINTRTLRYERTIKGFVGVKLTGSGAVDNNHSGPNGVTSSCC